MSPLGILGKGEVGEVVRLRGERHAATGGHGHGSHHGNGWQTGKRLAEMGFAPGQRIEIIENNPAMPMLVSVQNGRIAIDRSIAMQIMVRRVLV